jgi:signal transduction histidine kinase
VHGVVTAFAILNSILFVALAVSAGLRWRSRRDRAAGWIALAFLTLGLIVTVGRLLPAHPHAFLDKAGLRVEVELLVLFPFFLYRFGTAFIPPSRRLQQVVAVLTVGLTIWTFALPHFPTSGEHRPPAFVLYIIAFLVHWTLLSSVVTVRLWRAGRDQPAVARIRMRLLSFAAAALTVAIIGTAFATDTSSFGAAAAQGLAVLAAVAFLLGLDPPQIVRAYWRLPEQLRLQEAIRGLMTLAMTRAEVAERVLGPAAALVGARRAAIFDADGTLHATLGVSPDLARALADRPAPDGVVRVAQPGAVMLVWTSPYAPFFGEDELRSLESMAALTGVALDRVRLFEEEHSSRLALEHANGVMTNFVALAAHELRTPVTTVHGFVQTLNHLGDRLSEEQTHEIRIALEQQTARMAGLVEQLLDLSRLDAEAIDVSPQKVVLHERLAEVVAVAAGTRAAEVELDVAANAQAVVDPAILDHIVTNLVTNALRYGRAPIRVTATANGAQLRVSVEDSGPGVAREIESTLFERFTRAGVARDRVAGTGLGLSIARAYAQAHRGDLRYERGQPSGARFVVDLPSV